MMRNFVYQFYNEGFATTFCLKPIKFIKRIVKNELFCNILIVLVKIIYTLLMVLVAWKIFWIKYPF